MISLDHVGKVYQSRTGETWAVGDVSLDVDAGEIRTMLSG